MTTFSRIEDAIAAIGRGEIVVVVDDEDRENEGDLVMAAEAATPEKIAFFLAHTSGRHLRAAHRPSGPTQLELPLMVSGQHRVAAHRLHRQRRLPPRHHDGHLGRGPRRHHPGPDRPPHPPHRPQPARPHLPACATGPAGC